MQDNSLKAACYFFYLFLGWGVKSRERGLGRPLLLIIEGLTSSQLATERPEYNSISGSDVHSVQLSEVKCQ